MYYVNSLLFVVNGWVKFSALLQIRFQQVFPSPFLDICTEIAEQKPKKLTEKRSYWLLLCLVKVSQLNLVSGWKKDQYAHAHCSKQTSKLSQLQNIHLYLLALTFVVIYWLNRGKSLYISCWWKLIILYLRTLTVFEEKIVVRVHELFFESVHALFFQVLSNWQVSHCEIPVKIMFPSLFGSFINHLHHKANNNVLVKPSSLICITSILTTIYLLKVCSVYGGSCHNYSPKSIHVLLASILLTSRKNKKCS